MPDPDPSNEPGNEAKRRPHLPEGDVPPATPRWIGWAVITLAVLMVLQGAHAQYQQSQRAEERDELLTCLAHWATDLGHTLEERSRLFNAGEPTHTAPIPDVNVHCEGVDP